MYRIMIAGSRRDNYKTLYQYLTTTKNGATVPIGIETDEELDIFVEDMLNKKGYAKDDFVVVNVVDYKLDATEYSEYDFNEHTDDPEPEDKMHITDDGEGNVFITFD